jgi:hypothetical protein
MASSLTSLGKARAPAPAPLFLQGESKAAFPSLGAPGALCPLVVLGVGVWVNGGLSLSLSLPPPPPLPLSQEEYATVELPTDLSDAELQIRIMNWNDPKMVKGVNLRPHGFLGQVCLRLNYIIC